MLKPINENVIIEPLKEKGSKFILIMEENEFKGFGIVRAIGKKKNSRPEFKVGDKVIWDTKYGIQRFTDHDKEYIILPSYAYVLAII